MKAMLIHWQPKLFSTKFFKSKTPQKTPLWLKLRKKKLKQSQLEEEEEKIHFKENGQLSTN